jgi:AraC-like DNA-binding protein
LRALGYGRRSGRRSLEELWTQGEFHDHYLGAEKVVRARRPGKHPSQVEVAGEMGMSERHLRRLVGRYGLPGEKRS